MVGSGPGQRVGHDTGVVAQYLACDAFNPFGHLGGGASSWFDHAQNLYRDRSTNLPHRQCARRVAGNDQIFGAVFHQELNARNRVAGDRHRRFGAVGKARSITNVQVVCLRNRREKFAQYGETTDSGIEDADLHCSCATTLCIAAVL